jgi:hypothetical protein
MARRYKIERVRHGPGYDVRTHGNPDTDMGTFSIGTFGTYEQAKAGKKRAQETGMW